jgi:integrase
LGLLVLK